MVLPDESPLVLSLHWSDGVTTWQDGANGPTDDMLDTTPEANGDQDYFRPVERYSPKEIQWLQKLAMWLIETQDPELFKGRKFVLAELPAGYRLYEHVRVPGANSSIKARTDTYLYGHPKGPRKRYRSITEFRQHFLWLASDTNRNPKNCECRICCGKSEVTAEPIVDTPAQTSAMSTRGAAAKERAAVAAQNASPRAKVARRTATNTALAVASPAPTAPRRSTATTVNTRSSSSTPGPTLPTAAPFHPHHMSSSYTTLERALDATPGKNIFRPGELVWCHCTEAWSLGVIVARPDPESLGYTVQVLKSPLEAEMSRPYPGITLRGLRPWLAWSTPEITIPSLRTSMDFESINWDQFRDVRGLEVDASILKSRDIDTSYCLVDKIDYPHANFYAGVFYGAEKIWMGEIVRLKRHAVPQANLTGLEIMIVVSIQDHRKQPPNKTRTSSTDITVMGDIYEFVTYPSPTSTPPQIPQWLPPRLINETKIKNKVTSRASSNPTVGTWRCIQNGYSVKLEDIKGRWYESSILIPELKGIQKFTQNVQGGKWDELATQMNEMGNAGQAPARGWLWSARRDEVLTKAVPRGFALEKDSAMNSQGAQPGFAVHISIQQAQQQPPAVAAPAEMVDLTGEEDDYVPQEDQQPSDDEALTRQMEADVASFFRTEPVDSFYGSL
ncbi:transcription-silencing protein Clr2-domain-containing protein [Tuber indicum]|nr:transcription-silencing protein Clr2-domain-containing protein [Tuber indicum]